MDRKESKNKFIALLDKYGFEKSKFIVGFGLKETIKGDKYRYEYNASYSKNAETVEYFVKYFESIDKYLIWKAAKGKKRTCFSVDAEKVSNKLKVVKHIESKNGKVEEVMVLSLDEVEEFFKKIKNTGGN